MYKAIREYMILEMIGAFSMEDFYDWEVQEFQIQTSLQNPSGLCLLKHTHVLRAKLMPGE